MKEIFGGAFMAQNYLMICCIIINLGECKNENK